MIYHEEGRRTSGYVMTAKFVTAVKEIAPRHYLRTCSFNNQSLIDCGGAQSERSSSCAKVEMEKILSLGVLREVCRKREGIWAMRTHRCF